jgi:precorrin-2/cobalt-factor-2 C20-methyltransferase
LPRALVGRDQRLAVMPASTPDPELRAGLAFADCTALVKVGRHFGRLRALLDSLGLAEHACYIERASQPGQRVLPLALVDAASATYFSIVLVFKEIPK